MAPVWSAYTRARTSESELDLENDSAEKAFLSDAKVRWSKRLPERSWLTNALILTAAFLATLAAGAWAFHIFQTNFSAVAQLSAPDRSYKQHCGSTIAEAKALGCEFDLLGASWTPPACIDYELVDEFKNLKPWKYYADQKGTIEVLQSDLEKRPAGEEGAFYATLEYHQFHCGYEWKKMHRALAAGKPLESDLSDYHHTAHCVEKVQMDRSPFETIATKITIEFLSC